MPLILALLGFFLVFGKILVVGPLQIWGFNLFFFSLFHRFLRIQNFIVHRFFS